MSKPIGSQQEVLDILLTFQCTTF